MKMKMKEIQDWVESHKPHTAVISVVVLMAIALSVAYENGAFTKKQSNSKTDDSSVTATVSEDTQKAALTINIAADDKVAKDSTPVIIHVQSTDKRDKPVDFYHAIDSGKKTNTIEVSPGDYKVTVTGVINNDGSVTKPVFKSKEINVSIKSTDKSKDAENKAVVNVELDKTTPADKVTEKDVKEIAEATKTAIENGDDSLKGDAGKEILDKVEANTKANKHLSDDAKDAVAKSTNKAQASNETEAKTTVTEAPKSASNSKPAEKAKTWVPEKGHWENDTEQVWVPNVITVTDKEAWDENKTVFDYYLFADGYKAYTTADARTHAVYCLKNGLDDGYQDVQHTETVHHPAVTHTEDRGHYETKVTGRKWVVDEAGHYE